MVKTRIFKKFRPVLWVGLFGLSAASHGLDVHLQQLPPAPGLTPSEPLDSLEGLQNALNCGLDFLETAKQCGLSAPSQVVSPFMVSFDPLFCRLTMRFPIGELIDGLLKQWLAKALARVSTPVIGPLCLLGIGPQFCGGGRDGQSLIGPALTPGGPLQDATTEAAARQQRALREALKAATAVEPSASPTPPAPAAQTAPEKTDHDPTGLDRLLR